MDKFKQYADGVKAIQWRCACVRWLARDCYEARHFTGWDEDQPKYDDDECECGCHYDIARLEEDIWGEVEA